MLVDTIPSVKTLSKEAKEKKASAPKMPSKKELQPHTLSTEYIQDSESEDNDTSDTNSTSNDDSLPENQATSVLNKNKQTKIQVSESSSSSGSQSESESEDESESSQDSDQAHSEADKKQQAVGPDRQRKAQKVSKTTSASVDERAAYRPPLGFEQASIDDAPRISQMLNNSNLEGKEIWYITAPAAVPLSSLEDLSLQAIQERKQILSYNGDDYAFVPDSSESNASTKVMVPNSSNDGYRTGKPPISRIFHLQQTMPRANFTSQVKELAKKPVRQQPPGLKMRFHPIGFDPDLTGPDSSDQEMLDEPAAEFRKAGSISSSSESSESDEINSNANTTTETPHAKPRENSNARTFESTKVNGSSLKRKHSEGENKKSKNSSSRSANTTDDRKLKRVKSQVENQKTTDSQSASTEVRSMSSTILPPKVQSSKTRILPSSSRATATKIGIPSSAASLVISTDPPPLGTHTHAIDPNLAAEDHTEENKRLKKSRENSVSKSKQREEKASALSQPSASHMPYSEGGVLPSGEKDEKKNKKRRKEQISDGVKGKANAEENISVPRSETPILPPKYASKH